MLGFKICFYVAAVCSSVQNAVKVSILIFFPLIFIGFFFLVYEQPLHTVLFPPPLNSTAWRIEADRLLYKEGFLKPYT